MTEEQKFLRKISINYETGCWIWLGSRRGDNDQYGAINRGNSRIEQKHYTAHRYAYEKFYGPIPEGLDLHHHGECVSTLCCNPTHVDLIEKSTHGKLSSPYTSDKYPNCKNGHNRWGKSSDGRRCLECHRINEIKRYHEKRRQHGQI